MSWEQAIPIPNRAKECMVVTFKQFLSLHSQLFWLLALRITSGLDFSHMPYSILKNR